MAIQGSTNTPAPVVTPQGNSPQCPLESECLLRLDALNATPQSPVTDMASRSVCPMQLYRAEIQWGEYTYVLEQCLPKECTHWSEYVEGYKKVLEAAAAKNDPRIHSGVMQLELLPVKDQGVKVSTCGGEKHSLMIDDPTTKAFANAVCKRSQYTVPARATQSSAPAQACQAPIATSIPDPLPDDEKSQFPPTGLKNSSVQCYANALLQIIASCPGLNERVEHHAGNELLKSIMTQYQECREKKMTVSDLDTKSLFSVMEPTSDNGPQSALRQHCIGEAFTRIIIQNLPELNATVNTEYENKVPDSVTDLDEGYARKVESPGRAFQTRTIIEPPVLHPRIPTSDQPTDFVNLLRESQISTAVSGTSTISGQEYDLVSTRSTFASAPEFLAIQPNRIYQTSVVGELKKNQGQMDLLESFTMSEEMVAQDVTPPSYRLRGFAVHIGDQHNSGHYVAYVKIKGEDKNTHYYEIDDSRVRKVDFGEFLKAGKGFAFALYQNTSPQADS